MATNVIAFAFVTFKLVPVIVIPVIELALASVKLPVLGVVFPIAEPLIEPPVITAFGLLKFVATIVIAFAVVVFKVLMLPVIIFASVTFRVGTVIDPVVNVVTLAFVRLAVTMVMLMP